MKAIRWNAIFSIVYVIGFSLIMRNMDVFSCSFAMLGIAMVCNSYACYINELNNDMAMLLFSFTVDQVCSYDCNGLFLIFVASGKE